MEESGLVVQRGSGCRRLPAAAFLGMAFSGLVGCVTVVPYEPNRRIVDELGPDESARVLSQVLNRAVEPRITAVEVHPDRLVYRWDQPVQGPFWVGMGAVPREVQIHFANLEKVEVYENANVFLYGAGGRVDKVLFANLEDAKRFADFLQAYRERSGRAAAPAPASPPAPGSG